MPEFYYPYTEEGEDYSMKYESLVIHAFEGQHKYDDPLGFGAQDWYRNPIDDPKAGLLAAWGAIAVRFRDSITYEQKEELRELALNTKDAEEWPQLALVIDKGLDLYRRL